MGVYPQNHWKTVCYKHILGRILSIWTLLAGWFPEMRTRVPLEKELAVVRTTDKI